MGNCIGGSMMIKHYIQFKKKEDAEYLNTYDESQSEKDYSHNSIQLTHYCNMDKNNSQSIEL